MKCNVALWDRLLRFILGVLLLFYAIAGGPYWAFAGIYFIFTSAWGICFFYTFFKFQTAKTSASDFYKPPQG